MEKNQNSNTKNNESSIRSIFEGGMGSRLFAGIVDGLIFAFTWLVLAMWVFTPIANAGFKYNEKMSMGSNYQVVSHCFVYEQADDDGNFHAIEVKNFTEQINPEKKSRVTPLYEFDGTEIKPYVKRIHYYYHNYKCAKEIELPNNTPEKTFDPFADFYVDPEYNEPINGVLRENYYTNDWYLNEILDVDSENSFFKYEPSIEGEFADKILLKDEAQKENAIKYLKDKAYDAAKDLYNAKYYSDINRSLKWIQAFIVVPPYLLSFGAFFFLIPLLSKNNDSLGKKMMSLAIISNNGYSAKKRQIVFRQLILFTLISFSLIVVGIGFTSFATCGIMIVILLIATLISKTHRAPHDYAAYTLVVNTKKSVWFKDAEEEARKEKELEEKMAKYKSVDTTSKNVIQIGSKILDKDLEKEILEERNQENKETKK